MGTMKANEPPTADLLVRWRQGDEQAAEEIFRRYASRMVALARSRLSLKLSQRIDAEDVVQSACRSFFTGTREGRYDIPPGSDLWQLLVAITLNKLYLRIRFNSSQKRDHGRERGFSSEDSLLGLQPDLALREPSPDEMVALADELDQLMRPLKPLDRRILELRLEGHDLNEIAAQVQRSQRTVRRTLDQIKQRFSNWQTERSG
jgi:RNA polymerase sigma-70 factor (ECF subfamily)